MRTPMAGTVLRAVFNAMHAVHCGPDCPPSCREWQPDEHEMRAAISAVRNFDSSRGRMT